MKTKEMQHGAWNEVLDWYEYPKRPCDTTCVEGCIARSSCPLYKAWESMKLDDSLMSSYIRSNARELSIVIRNIGGGIKGFCDRIKQAILRNLEEGTDTVGFDVIYNSKKRCQIVDRATQIPCTDWHNHYTEVLDELKSIVKVA